MDDIVIQPTPTVGFGTKLATAAGVVLPILAAVAAALADGTVSDWKSLVLLVVAAISGNAILASRTSQANALAEAVTTVVTAPEPDNDIPDHLDPVVLPAG